ncbi:redoxin domain-containing protein [Candidatus Sumerlaeota bacterium]|nr:redoxin domain-containing protein [Candidatus Sumerlaeota bacterium]
MMRISRFLPLCLLTAALVAAPALALTLGESAEGALTEDDPIGARDTREDTLSLAVEAGQLVVIDLFSEDFDAYLRVTLPGGAVVANDDSQGTDSRVVFIPAESGEATIAVSSLLPHESGTYTLETSSVEIQSLAMDEPLTTTCSMDRRGTALLTVTEGEGVMLTLESEAEAAFLMIMGPDGQRAQGVSHSGGNVSVVYLPGESGPAPINFAAGSMRGQGAVECTVTASPLEVDETLAYEGEPLEMSGELDEGEGPEVIALTGPPRQRLQIDLMSSVFDAFLQVAGAGQSLENDDGGYATNSRLTLWMPPRGEVVLLASAFGGMGEGDWTLQVTDPGPLMAPPFTLTDTEGQRVSLADSDGEVRIVDFWATWCPPCIAEIPHFNEIAEEYAGRVTLLGISTDDSEEDLAEFLEEEEMGYTILRDNRVVSRIYGALLDSGQMEGIPTTFVIDQTGEVAAIHEGYTEKSVFIREIEALLAETP